MILELSVLVCVICFVVLFVAFNHRAQTFLIYLHWLRPPLFINDASDIRSHGLYGIARNIQVENLHGWHVLPGTSPSVISEEEFSEKLSKPGNLVVVFFHGNFGTRSFPKRRVEILRTLAIKLNAHVITFDYSGFAESTGRPSEQQFESDSRHVYSFVKQNIGKDPKLLLYGGSLGSFAALSLAAQLSDEDEKNDGYGYNISVLLECAPSNLLDACTSHIVAAPFRLLPWYHEFFSAVLKETIDNTKLIHKVRYPILITHGEKDGLVSSWQAKKLHRHAVSAGNKNVTLKLFPECGHTNVFGTEGYFPLLQEFLR